MAFNLFDSVKSLLGTDLASKAGSIFGEDESKIQKGISAAIPSVLTGILNKASSGEVHEVLKLSKEANESGIISGAGNFFGNNHLLARGADFVKSLFGERMSDVTNSIAGFSGMKSTSVASLLSYAAPAALANVGREADKNNMTTSDLLGFLNTQKENIIGSIPSGLNLANALGITSLANIGNRLSGEFSTITGRSNKPQEGMEEKKRTPWLFPLILVLAGGALLWWLFGGRNNKEEVAVSSVNADTIVPAAVTPVMPNTQSIKVKLPNGVELDAYKGGIEDHLVAFLNDPSSKADKNTWFDFDHVNFELSSAVITPESGKQLQNIVEILKAFPTVSIKIGGYTDKTGDEPGNMKLSQARADAIANALKENGVADAQLSGSEGYGSQFAKEPATASDEDRRKDRRMAVSPRKK